MSQSENILKENQNDANILSFTKDPNLTIWNLKHISKDEQNNQIQSNDYIVHKALGVCLKKIKPKNINNITRQYYTMKIEKIKDDIFPVERNPEINFFNETKENFLKKFKNQKNNYYKDAIDNKLTQKFDEYLKKILNSDVPEMILYKYKYDIDLFENSLKDENLYDEAEFIFNSLKSKFDENTISQQKNDIVYNIKQILTIHKKDKKDIFLLIKENFENFSKYFTEDDIINILSLYDVEYLKFFNKKNKLCEFFSKHPIISQNSILKEIYQSKTELDFFLNLFNLGLQLELNFENNKDKNYINLFHPNIHLNNKKIINIAIEYNCDEIVNKFCLTTEEVAHNIQILLGEKNGQLKEPNNKISLTNLCIDKTGQLSNKKILHPAELLQKCIEFYIINLSSNFYISKKIFEVYKKIATINTTPTENGEIILNSQHPDYVCKRINNCPLELFLNNDNIEFSSLYLQIEKCVNDGLINFNINIDLLNPEIQNLTNLLNKAINGFNDEKEHCAKFKEMNSDQDNKNIVNYLKNVMARKVAVKNMIVNKFFTRKFFIDFIQDELHQRAEKNLIKQISDKFYGILTRKYISENDKKDDKKNEKKDDKKNEINYFSISFLNSNEFYVLCLDVNSNKRSEVIFKYLFDGKNYEKSSELNEIKSFFRKYQPKKVILNTDNINYYKLYNLLKENIIPYFDIEFIFSDYLSLFKQENNYQQNKNPYSQNNIKDYYMNVALEQFKYVSNPLYYFIENWNFKYAKNLLMNLSIDRLQSQIKDVVLLNYLLEIQIFKAQNKIGPFFKKLQKIPKNYFCFINGSGPIIGQFLYKSGIKIINEETIKIENCTYYPKSIIENINYFLSIYINENADMKKNYELSKDDVFNNIISKNVKNINLKNNELYNVYVKEIDEENKYINCILFYNSSMLECKLNFDEIGNYKNDKNTYFTKGKALLCKIIDIKISNNNYEIFLTNKFDDLEILSNDNITQIIPEKIKTYLFSKKEDCEIANIKKLIEIINKNETLSEKTLKKINIESGENYYKKNCSYKDMYNNYINVIDNCYIIRPSFIGEDHLTLSFRIFGNIFLNYDIEILNKDNIENRKYLIKCDNNKKYEYTTLDELNNNFSKKLQKFIHEFKFHNLFKDPNSMEKLFTKILNNESINEDKILCFMQESPDYALLITKNINESYYNIDYINFTNEGFLFHNKIFKNLDNLLEYYDKNYFKPDFKEFSCRNVIYITHQLISEIDMQYDKFEPEKNIEELNWADNNNQNNQYLQKKRQQSNFGWENNNKNPENDWENNNNSNWLKENDNHNKEDNNNINNFNWSDNNNDNKNNKNDDGWGSINNDNNNKQNDDWGTLAENNNSKNDIKNNNDVWGPVDENNNKKEENKINDSKIDLFWGGNNLNNKNLNNNESSNNNWGNDDYQNNNNNYGSNNNDNWVNVNNNKKNNNYNKNNTGNNNYNKNYNNNKGWKSNDYKNKRDNWGRNNNNKNNDYENKKSNFGWEKNNNNNNNNNDNWGGNNESNYNIKNNDWGNENNNNNNDNWGVNTNNDNWGNNNNNNSNNNDDGWGGNNTNNNYNDSWGNNNNNINNNNDAGWGEKNNNNQINNNDTCGNNNNNNNDNWGVNTNNDNWGNKNNDNWGNNNNNSNNNDNWGVNTNNDNWGNNNNNSNNNDNWGVNTNNDNWGNNNNNNDSWGVNNNNDNWGNNNNNNDNWGVNNNNNNFNSNKDSWNKNDNYKKNNNYNTSNNNNNYYNNNNQNDNKNSNWGNNDNYNKNNNNDAWGNNSDVWDNNNNSDGWNNNNQSINDDSWLKNDNKNNNNNDNYKRNNNYRNNSKTPNKNYNQNNNRKNYGNSNNNNNYNNRNNNYKNNNNYDNNNRGYNNRRYNNYGNRQNKNKEKKNNWATGLDDNRGQDEIKDETGEEHNFEGNEEFGGFKTEKNENNDSAW